MKRTNVQDIVTQVNFLMADPAPLPLPVPADFLDYTLAGTQVLFGGVQMVGGGIIAFGTAETGVGVAGGGAILIRGMDNTTAGIHTFTTGTVQPTMLNQGVTNLTGSPMLGGVTEFAVDFVSFRPSISGISSIRTPVWNPQLTSPAEQAAIEFFNKPPKAISTPGAFPADYRPPWYPGDLLPRLHYGSDGANLFEGALPALNPRVPPFGLN